MKSKMLGSERVALHSSDGKIWQRGFSEETKGPLKWPTHPDLSVGQIVIGEPPRRLDDQATTTLESGLPENLQELFPELRSLYLWGISNLTSLPELPPHLECLDVRFCANLTSIPKLPDSLVLLDVGQCFSLEELPVPVSALEKVYFNRCKILPDFELESFLKALSKIRAPVNEIDGSGCPAVRSLKQFPRTLRRLNLRECPNLDSLDGLEEFTSLQYLNLGACPKLSIIPSLPENKIQYLEVYGCENLKQLMDQGIGVYDRGSEERLNVSDGFYTRKKFGSEIGFSAHAKLLLLGDGRVGKTTLAKRLHWEHLSDEEKLDPRKKELFCPKEKERFTDKVWVSHLKTAFQFEKESAQDLNRAAESRKLPAPCDSDGRMPGKLRIWDFGGQEIYHQTHRIFSAEGSVFLLVWNDLERDLEKLKKECPEGCPLDQWMEWNRKRSLDYWLDFVDSLNTSGRKVQVALVCTHCGPNQKRPNWGLHAPRHEKRNLPCFYLDLLDEQCGSSADYSNLLKWLQECCGVEASRIQPCQPRFYTEISDGIETWLEENQDTEKSGKGKRPLHTTRPFSGWSQELKTRHQTRGISKLELDDQDIEAITGYLHDSGQIYVLKTSKERVVVIDQKWASDLIYSLVSGGSQSWQLPRIVRDNHGYFRKSYLDGNLEWKYLSTDLERDQILQFMEECGLIFCLHRGSGKMEEDPLYLATTKCLLPAFEDFKAEMDKEWNLTTKNGGFEATAIDLGGLSRVSELKFQTLRRRIGEEVGDQGRWFQSGLQAIDLSEPPQWALRLEWLEDQKDSFYGNLRLELACSPEQQVDFETDLQNLLAGALGLPKFHFQTSDGKPEGVVKRPFESPSDSDYDIAVSSNGADSEMVGAMVESLKSAGLRVTWYRIPECRTEENREVMRFMESLRRPPCILIHLSDAYLGNDPKTNWYCLWELADAMMQVHEGKRSMETTFVTYPPVGKIVNSKSAADIARGVVRQMSEYFDQKHCEIPRSDRRNFKYYDDWAELFLRVLETEAFGEFFKKRGTLGTYSHINKKEDGTWDFSEIIQAVKQSVNKK